MVNVIKWCMRAMGGFALCYSWHSGGHFLPIFDENLNVNNTDLVRT